VKHIYALLFVVACYATGSQIGQTFVDGLKSGACIAGALLSGQDPLTCEGATEAFVIDVANDVEAKQQLTAEQKAHIDSERVRMATRLAQKAPGK